MRLLRNNLEFCPVLASLIASDKLTGLTGKKFDNLSALSTVNNLLTIRSVLLSLKPARTLEIGLAFGGSCLVFTQTHKDLDAPPKHQHVAIDPYQKQVWDEVALSKVEEAGLKGYLDFRASFSCHELPRMVEQGEECDMAYIDGSHLVEDVFVDFYYIARLLTKDGLVLFDDATDPHVHKVINFVRTNYEIVFREMDLAPYRQDRGKTVRYKSAKFLGKTQLVGFEKIGNPPRAWNSKFVNY